jgi:hypothetical protein
MYRLWKGRKVRIFSATRNKELGIGTFINHKMTSLGVTTPKFRLGRKIIYGYECYWIPMGKIK